MAEDFLAVPPFFGPDKQLFHHLPLICEHWAQFPFASGPLTLNSQSVARGMCGQ